jgi:Glucodextranase, domain B
MGGWGIAAMMPDGRRMLGPMLTVALAASLAALVAGGGALPPPGPSAVARVPDEPGAFVLPDSLPTLQAVAADLDGDGAPEVVRLVGRGGERLWVEAWREGPDGWALAAPPTLAVRGVAGQAELAYARRPVRLLVRRAGGGQRVTLLRQPDFSEPDAPRECCLLIDDIVLAGGALHIDPVADPGGTADSVHVIDLDGDGTDELLATYSLEPLNDASSPTVGRVLRWTDGRFAPPTSTEMPVGSGSSPFILGDSDGVPGEEAAFISSAALGALFRVSLGADDRLLVEHSGMIVTDAVAVPLGARRGIAVQIAGGVQVRDWPRGAGIGAPSAEAPLAEGTFLGVVEILDEPRLLLRQTDPEALHVLGLPNLTPPRGNAITRSPAAAALAAGPLSAYVGPLPGGGLDGGSAVLYAGRLLPSDDLPDAPLATHQAALFGTLAGSDPVGLVGRDRGWLAIRQAPTGVPGRDDPRGGRLTPPAFQSGSSVSIAPVDLVRHPEAGAGRIEPPLEGATMIGARELAIGTSGLVAEVTAPPGSRVYLPDPDPSVVGRALTVGDGGTLRVTVPPPAGLTQNVRYRLSLHVLTPAGHGYVASWPVQILARPPELDATMTTPVGSADVTVSGRTDPYASITIAGRAVAVDADGRFSTTVPLPPWPTEVSLVASDPAGNESTVILTGIGILDYRGLPWAQIALVLLGAVAVVLVMRVPRSRPSPRALTDDGVLEELDPADRL